MKPPPYRCKKAWSGSGLAPPSGEAPSWHHAPVPHTHTYPYLLGQRWTAAENRDMRRHLQGLPPVAEVHKGRIRIRPYQRIYAVLQLERIRTRATSAESCRPPPRKEVHHAHLRRSSLFFNLLNTSVGAACSFCWIQATRSKLPCPHAATCPGYQGSCVLGASGQPHPLEDPWSAPPRQVPSEGKRRQKQPSRHQAQLCGRHHRINFPWPPRPPP